MQSQEWTFLNTEQGREEQKTDLGAIIGQNCFLGNTEKIGAELALVIWNWFKIFQKKPTGERSLSPTEFFRQQSY